MSSCVDRRDRLYAALLSGDQEEALGVAQELRDFSESPVELHAAAAKLRGGLFEEVPAAFLAPSLLGNQAVLDRVADVLTDGLEPAPRLVSRLDLIVGLCYATATPAQRRQMVGLTS